MSAPKMKAPAGRLNRAAKQEQTRTALRQAAASLVAEQGLQATSIEQISAEAGFSRGAFYANYRSKEELFAELLQERIYEAYRQLAREWREADEPPTPRQTGERLASIIGAQEGKWLFSLWLELLAHAARDSEFRTIAAEFWRGTRQLAAAGVRETFRERGEDPPIPAEALATTSIAIDIGLAIQHVIDPDEVPLDTYPTVFEWVFGPR